MDDIKELFIEVTNQCPQKCIHCSSMSSMNSDVFIPIDKIKEIIMKTKPLGLDRVVISGGEPFLYPKLKELIIFIKDNGLKVTVYSCGVQGNIKNGFRPITEDDFKNLKLCGLNHVIFSLHAASEEMQERISGIKGSFRCVLESITNAQKAGYQVELHTVPMKINIEYIHDLIELAKKINIDRLSILRYVPQGRGTDLLTPSLDQYKKMLEIVEKITKNKNGICIRLGAPFNMLNENSSKCSAGFGKLLISAHGEVLPCEAFKFLRESQPNIYDDDILNIWKNGELLNKIRNIRDNDSNICFRENDKERCSKGCLGQKLLCCGDLIEGVDPIC